MEYEVVVYKDLDYVAFRCNNPERQHYTLDIGCCDAPNGDVNCDIFTHGTKEHLAQWEGERDMNVRSIPNFVQCDAQYLPFKDNAFTEVSASQVLEHIPNYIQALCEFIRVANHAVYISVPAVEKEIFPEMHLHFFHPRTFGNALRYVGFRGRWIVHRAFDMLVFLLQKE